MVGDRDDGNAIRESVFTPGKAREHQRLRLSVRRLVNSRLGPDDWEYYLSDTSNFFLDLILASVRRAGWAVGGRPFLSLEPPATEVALYKPRVAHAVAPRQASFLYAVPASG